MKPVQKKNAQTQNNLEGYGAAVREANLSSNPNTTFAPKPDIDVSKMSQQEAVSHFINI